MIYISLIILISSSIFVTFRLFERYNVDNFQAITINYLVGSVFGISISGSQFQADFIINKAWLTYSVIIGILFIFTFVLFALSSQKAGVAITAVFSKMSVIIPVIAGIILYSETLNVMIIMGIVSTLAAFILIFYKKEKNKIRLSIILLPVLLFFANGIIDTLLKYIEHHFITDDYTLFLTFVFISALIIGAVISTANYIRTKKPFSMPTIAAGIILGLLNFSTTYFMLKAMNLFQSNVLFPVQNVGIVMVSALFGFFLFREKLSLINWLGILLSVMAISLIAFA